MVRASRPLTRVREVTRVAPALVLLALAGFVLGACGGSGGGALSTRTGLTVTRTTVTRTTATETTTVAPEPPPPPVAATTTADSSSNSTPWGWILLGIGLALALLVVIVAWRRRRTSAEGWGHETAELNRRALATLDDVFAKGSIVTGHVEALAGEARSLERGAPDDASRAAAANVRGRLEGLAAVLEQDRTLRLATPPPSAEQLRYSDSLIREQAEELRRALRYPGGAP